MQPRPCSWCGEVFTPYPYNPGQTMCGRACRNASMAERNRTTQRVNKPGGLTEVEKDKIRVSRLDTGVGLGYRKINGRHEHRVVAEAILGRPLTTREHVHHEDLNKRNNDPSNLIVFPSAAWHARHHKLGHPGQDTCDCECIRLKEVII